MFVRAALALTLACACFAAIAGPFTSITVFGDSLSDAGNDYIYTGGAFPPAPYDMRFSNGPVSIERLASNLGLALTPSLAGGSDYAYGGAETGYLNYLRFTPALSGAFGGTNTGVLAQVADFTSSHSLGASGLVVLWAGPNDLFSALATSSDPFAAMSAALGNLGTATQELYADGARTILMPNMPDIGQTPFGLSLGASGSAYLSAISAGFDVGLNALAGDLEHTDPGLNIIGFNTYALLDSVIADPGAYGLVNVTDPCFDATSSSVCANPNSYLFWDSVHPTEATQQFLGDAMTATVLAATVPEPSMIALILIALIGALVAPRRTPRRLACSWGISGKDR